MKELTFCTNNTWLIKITESGIEFNKKDFPAWTAEMFAREFIHILETDYKISMQYAKDTTRRTFEDLYDKES